MVRWLKASSSVSVIVPKGESGTDSGRDAADSFLGAVMGVSSGARTPQASPTPEEPPATVRSGQKKAPRERGWQGRKEIDRQGLSLNGPPFCRGFIRFAFKDQP